MQDISRDRRDGSGGSQIRDIPLFEETQGFNDKQVWEKIIG